MKGMTKMTNFLPVVAEASASGGNQSSSMIFMILFYVAIFAALYFFLIRPNSKKKKEEAQLRNSLEIGDEITTIGGIMGRVVAIKDDEDAIIIETGSDRVKMKFKSGVFLLLTQLRNSHSRQVSLKRKASSALARRKILTKLKLQRITF